MNTKDSQQQTDSQILAKRAAQVQRGGARAAVLGANDGLVSVVCIVLGVAAAGSSQHAVFVAGLAGLIAGAVSMAAGEWISVQSQVDLFSGVLDDLRVMIKKDKNLLVSNLRNHLQGDGYSKSAAIAATNDLIEDEEKFFVTYAEQVVGVNPDELGSPWTAAISSLALFTLGALAPLLPWVFTSGLSAIIWSISLTSLGGLFAGGFVASTSGRPLWYGAIRQFLIVLLAAVVTYAIGSLFGTHTS